MGLQIDLTLDLPASKSESNRALIIKALAEWQSGAQIVLENLSEANDTKLLHALLQNAPNEAECVFDAQDAGTTFRFLTAFLAVKGAGALLTGTPRMQERPIGILVEALRELGADIVYAGKVGFPPLRIADFKQKTPHIEIQADVSSQFISALLLIAPVLPEGLHLRLVGKVASKPYIEMTLAQMAHFGINAEVDWSAQSIRIAPQKYCPQIYAVESDWSAASYWYSAFALGRERVGRQGRGNVLLKGLHQNSLQGDKVITTLMRAWGVESVFVQEGVVLKYTTRALPAPTAIDFRDCPDLAQTILPMIVGLKDNLTWWRFTGLESLRLKETDRITALSVELRAFGAELYEESTGTWVLRAIQKALPAHHELRTYHDHRMAMGFAPLLQCFEFDIEKPEVVRKSYPNFWQEWQKFWVDR